jgi:hypothetical protein
MKLIVTHKKQLIRASDVSRFIAYCYGPKGSRPLLPVEGYMPGLPTGDPTLDAESLLSQHHGGKAAKGRSIVISSDYFHNRETAVTHAAAMTKSASAFRMAWAPQTNALSVVHLTQGEKKHAGMWRLDCHLILANTDGQRGIQWTRQQCSQMQDMAWIPEAVTQQFNITSGKGTGVRRTEKIPYPKSENLVAYEIGTLNNHQIENGISCGHYGAARRAKDGRIISIETQGKRINIARARHLVAVRDGATRDQGLLFTRGASNLPARGSIDPGINQIAPISLPTEGTNNDLGGGVEARARPSACADHIRQRRRRLSGGDPIKHSRETGLLGLGTTVRRSSATTLAAKSPARAILSGGTSLAKHISAALTSFENVQILNMDL